MTGLTSHFFPFFVDFFAFFVDAVPLAGALSPLAAAVRFLPATFFASFPEGPASSWLHPAFTAPEDVLPTSAPTADTMSLFCGGAASGRRIDQTASGGARGDCEQCGMTCACAAAVRAAGCSDKTISSNRSLLRSDWGGIQSHHSTMQRSSARRGEGAGRGGAHILAHVEHHGLDRRRLPRAVLRLALQRPPLLG